MAQKDQSTELQARLARSSYPIFPDLFPGPGALYLASKWPRRGQDNYPLMRQL